MPDKRRHRGANPRDGELFAAGRLAALRSAVGDLSWLLGRGYTMDASIKLVGDHYGLAARQRMAVVRSACSDEARSRRAQAAQPPETIANKEVAIDGYNLLITIEAALAGGVILGGRDGTFRDLASVHGSYRTMDETVPALELIGQHLSSLGCKSARWLLDSPVSNSGRLAKRMRAIADAHGWDWSVELLAKPDAELIASPLPVITSDSIILDRCTAWINLARQIIQTHIPKAWIVDIG